MKKYKQYTYFPALLDQIVYSVVTPVYNQERIIVKNVNSVIQFTKGLFEVILVLDYCFDETETRLLSFLSSLTPPPNLVQITIYKESVKPLFETKCDNIGFRNALGTFCLEIQADIEITEMGYNLQLSRPFIRYANVIAVSGRCAHQLFDVMIGTGDGDRRRPLDRDTFYVYETCNRGPLLLDRKKLEELDYLDEENYFLDDSDHDLMARAFFYKNYICGHVPINYNSPIEDGSTRRQVVNEREEDRVNQTEKDRIKTKLAGRPGLAKFLPLWYYRHPVLLSL